MAEGGLHQGRGDERCLGFFFFNDPATTEIYTLSLHDALPISRCSPECRARPPAPCREGFDPPPGDRKSSRLNSSHGSISYAVFCLTQKITPLARTTISIFSYSCPLLLRIPRS